MKPAAGYSLAAALVILAPSAASACMVQPPQWNPPEISARSDAIVAGILSYRYDRGGNMRGTVAVRQADKGPKQPSFSILHDPDFDPGCQPSGWAPPWSLTPRRIAGRFYLMRVAQGTYVIARFAVVKVQ